MKRALIEPSGRVAQVEAADFPVAPPLRWVECPDEAKPETHYFDGAAVVAKPVQPPPPIPTQAELEAHCIAGASAPPGPRFGFDVHRAFIAHVISCEAYRLSKAPGALTGAELSAIRQRVANIYKAL